MFRVLSFSAVCVSAAATVRAALAAPAVPAATEPVVWKVTVAEGTPDQVQCADMTERYFAAQGYRVSRKAMTGNDPEIMLAAAHRTKALKFMIYCRPSRDLTIIARGADSDIEADLARFRASLTSPSRAPVTRSADSTEGPRVSSNVSANIRYHGTAATCLAESQSAFARMGYRFRGSLAGRLAVGSSDDQRFFAVVDCALTSPSTLYSSLNIRLGVKPDVTAPARDAAATQLAKGIGDSPIDRQRAQVALDRWNREQERLQQAQMQEAHRVAQAQADAAAQAYSYARPPYQIDENEVARRAAGVIQSENAQSYSSGGSSGGYSGGAIIVDNYNPIAPVSPPIQSPSYGMSNQSPPSSASATENTPATHELFGPCTAADVTTAGWTCNANGVTHATHSGTGTPQ